MTLRTLTVRGIPEPVLKTLRAAAKKSRRSLNAEVLVRLEAGAAGVAAKPTSVVIGDAADCAAATVARVAEPAGQSYEVRRAFDEADLSRLRSDLALTPEQRVHLGEELARVSAAQRRRPRFQRVIQFDRYEDYLDWKRYGDRAP
jgi:hypothetical protein